MNEMKITIELNEEMTQNLKDVIEEVQKGEKHKLYLDMVDDIMELVLEACIECTTPPHPTEETM